jgi:hypothetical protein
VLTLPVSEAPVHGSVEYDPGIGFSYSPAAGYSGPDEFTFTASDGFANSSPFTVHITVLKPNHPPRCVSPLTLHIAPGDSVALESRLACSDPDGDALSPTLVSAPQHGSLTLPGGVPTYTADSGFEGLDTLTYRANDPRGATSNLATLNFVISRPASAATPAPPPAAPPSADTTSPTIAFIGAPRQSWRTLRRRGLKLVIRSSEPCRLRLALSVDGRTARRLGIRRRADRRVRVGSASGALAVGRTALVVPLKSRARSGLRHLRRIRLRIDATATDAAGNRRTRVTSMTIQR